MKQKQQQRPTKEELNQALIERTINDLVKQNITTKKDFNNYLADNFLEDWKIDIVEDYLKFSKTLNNQVDFETLQEVEILYYVNSNDEFKEYLLEEYKTNDIKILLENRDKILEQVKQLLKDTF